MNDVLIVWIFDVGFKFFDGDALSETLFGSAGFSQVPKEFGFADVWVANDGY